MISDAIVPRIPASAFPCTVNRIQVGHVDEHDKTRNVFATLTAIAPCELDGEITRCVNLGELRKALVDTFVVVQVLGVEALSIHKPVTAEKLFGRLLRTRFSCSSRFVRVSSTQQGSLSF